MKTYKLHFALRNTGVNEDNKEFVPDKYERYSTQAANYLEAKAKLLTVYPTAYNISVTNQNEHRV